MYGPRTSRKKRRKKGKKENQPFIIKVHRRRSANSKNSITAECLFGKSTICKVLDPRTHHLQCKRIAVGEFLEKSI